MHAREPIPASLNLSFPLAKRLARAAAAIEGGDVAGETGRSETGRSETTSARGTASNSATNTNPKGSLTTALDDDASHDDSLEDETDDHTDKHFDAHLDDAIDLDDATETTSDQHLDAEGNDEPHTAPAAKANSANVGAGKGIASKRETRAEDDDDDDQEKSPLQEELANRLKRWRGKTSAALGIPAYRVLSNATIARLAAERPDSTDRLEQVSGIGPSTTNRKGNSPSKRPKALRRAASRCHHPGSIRPWRNRSPGSRRRLRADPPK
jgi:superfamily II DNA helicase RecQ